MFCTATIYIYIFQHKSALVEIAVRALPVLGVWQEEQDLFGVGGKGGLSRSDPLNSKKGEA